MKRPPLQRAEKVLLGSSVLLIAPMLLASWFYSKQNQLPPAPHANKIVPPSPNAFDLILLAASQVSPAPRAKYSRTACLANGIEWEASCEQWKEPRPYTKAYNRAFPLDKKRLYLQANQTALETWRQSLLMPLLVPEKRDQSLNRTWNRRTLLTFALKTQARARWQSGKPGESLEWLLLWHQDICRSTLSFYGGKNHSNGIDKLDSVSETRAFAMEEFERLMPYLNAPQLRRAALKLQENRLLLPSRVEAIQVSKKKHLEFVRQICEKNDLRCYYDLKHPENVIPENMGLSRTLLTRFRWSNKKAGLQKVAAQWDWFLSQARLPPQMARMQLPESLQMEYSDVFGRMQAHLNSGDDGQATQIDAREAVLLSAMAARAFTLQNGRNPRDLKELVPRYLRKVEADPFSRAHSLKYSAKPKTYPLFVLGIPIFKPPLPRSATPFPTPVPLPPVPEGSDPPPGAPPVAPQPLGYLSSNTKKTLPFLLYSVGQNGRNDGGMDFKAAALPYWKWKWNQTTDCDDVLALAHWFSVLELEKRERDERNARLFQILPVGAPPP